MTTKLTKNMVCEAVSRSLYDFGYSGITGAMVGDILDAWVAGKRFPELPHGVIGAFAEEQFKGLQDQGLDFSTLEAAS